MLDKIRRFLMKHDPLLRPAKVSENLYQPLKQPEIIEVTKSKRED